MTTGADCAWELGARRWGLKSKPPSTFRLGSTLLTLDTSHT